MAQQPTVFLKANAEPVLAAIKELKECLQNLSDIAKGVVKSIVVLPENICKIVRIHHSSTVGTTINFILEPTDCFRNLLAALKAGKVDRHSIEEIFHDATRQESQ